MTQAAINRLVGWILLLSIVVMLPVVATRVISQASLSPAWWDALFLSWLAVIILGCVTSGIGITNVRIWAGSLAALSLLGHLSLPLVATDFTSEPPWIAALSAAAGGSLGLLMRPAYAVFCSLALIAAQAYERAHAGQSALATVIGDCAFIIVCAVGVGIALEVLRSGARGLEAAELAAVEAASAVSAQDALAAESARWDALVHDEVLATLETAARGNLPAATIAALATSSMAAINRDAVAGTAPASDLEERVLRLCYELGAEANLDVDRSARLPSALVHALANAVSEAARNAQQHAGASRTTVSGVVTASRVQLSITDNGQGFDPRKRRAGSLGIPLSIRGQMQSVGGHSTIDSARGRGTTVELSWRSEAS